MTATSSSLRFRVFWRSLFIPSEITMTLKLVLQIDRSQRPNIPAQIPPDLYDSDILFAQVPRFLEKSFHSLRDHNDLETRSTDRPIPAPQHPRPDTSRSV